MTAQEQRAAARKFAEDWNGRGDEKQDTQVFWIALLQHVFGVERPTEFIQFEKTVQLSHTSFIDGYIPQTKVLIEQKGKDIKLKHAYRQSDGSSLTPYQQAQRYAGYLPYEERPRWIIVCNFQEFNLYDTNYPNGEPEVIRLSDLEKEYHRLACIVNENSKAVKKEMEVSIAAGEIVGKLYNALLRQYNNPEDEESLKSLNVLCVRLVFCLYAEDAEIFGSRNMFLNYLQEFDTRHMRKALIELFQVLDTKPEERDPYLEPELAAFPYVNGGLFAKEDIEIPQFTEEIRELLLEKASADFDWSDISPTIFGAVFESTLNPETRRKGGMHYTSIENIHKVIDPLFLDDLRAELNEIQQIQVDKTRKQKLEAYRDKLSQLTFLDPAAGSGNFLTETYLCLRRLENQALRLLSDQLVMGDTINNPIKVSIQQFYGIEINDFAVTVAKTALWIAESQMLKETEDIISHTIDFLPLKSYVNIVEANALRMDWETVVPKNQLNYIMGNPPFVGGMFMKDEQKYDIRLLYDGLRGAGELDYVTGWYKKATELILDNAIRCAFVSTNSICQGSQVITFWKYIIENYNIHIDFAHTTFVWNSEAQISAKVHCVIVGFSGVNAPQIEKRLYSSGNRYVSCKEISPYLTNGPVTFIQSRSKPLCHVPAMRFGSMPRDGGGFVLSAEEREQLISKEPISEKWIKPYIGATEFLNKKSRFCLWLVNANPKELNNCPTVKQRIEFVRQTRASSKAAGTRKFADTPTLFCQIAQPDSDYILVPKTSSSRRKYLPLGFMDKDTIASDLVFLIPDAGLYEFGVLMSNIHNAWMRLVAGRLKSDYRYSKDIVYNNFPWPDATDAQKSKIEQTAQGILDARALYPDSSLADLYDELTMPPELRKAHQKNDQAVLAAYGIKKGDAAYSSESACVAELMRRYQALTEA